MLRNFPGRVLAERGHVWDHGVLCPGGSILPPHNTTQVYISGHYNPSDVSTWTLYLTLTLTLSADLPYIPCVQALL